MKIKKFNEYNGGDDDYYKEIDKNTYHQASTKIWNDGELLNEVELLEFDKREIEEIKSIVAEKEEYFVIQYDVDVDYEVPTYINIRTFTDSTKRYYKNHIDIKKMSDEWFYTSTDMKMEKTFYKCDQFDGLIEFLNDKL